MSESKFASSRAQKVEKFTKVNKKKRVELGEILLSKEDPSSFVPIKMTFLTYLVAKQKYNLDTRMLFYIKKRCFIYILLTVYMTSFSFYRKWQSPPEQETDENIKKCNFQISWRMLMLFLLVLLPSLLVTFFGAYCNMRKYRRRLQT